MDEALTREQIEELRPDDDAPMVADVRSDHMRTLCDMALRSLQPDAADYFRAGRILGESSGDTVRVPVEPTDKMCVNGANAIRQAFEEHDLGDLKQAELCYRAMLAAAPKEKP